jgi:broad specificity phosphatase PhoE
MREIEIRRHSCTKKGEGRGQGSHLSTDGVALAREVSEGMGRFDLVLASEIPRTLETALAMGYAVDALLETPHEIADPAMEEIGHHERWGWDAPWERFAEFVRQGGAVTEFAHWIRRAWTAALNTVPDGSRVLIISHGRYIEIGVIACLDGAPDFDLAGWGEPLHQCEGVRLSYDNHQFGDPRLLRTRHCQR